MEKSQVLDAMATLSSGVRLDAYQLAGVVSGEIAATLGLRLTNTSFHLKMRVQAGLATVEQEGRFQRYRANIPRMREGIAFLTRNCCADQPGACRAMRFRNAGPGCRAPAHRDVDRLTPRRTRIPSRP